MVTNMLIRSKTQRMVVLFGLIILTLTLFLGRGQQISWASPDQDPQRQTVPPRTPTFTPAPAPTVESSPTPSNEADDDDDDTDDGAILPPTPLPNTDEGPGADERPPSPIPSGPDDEISNDEIPPPGQSEPQPEETPLSPDQVDKTEGGQLALEPADLSLTKTVTDRRPEVGAVITFTITVRNDGPGRGTGVVVGEPMPTQMTLNSFWPSQGEFNPGTGRWTIGAIFPGQVVTLSVIATVMDGNIMTNTAEIVVAAAPDPDSRPGNNLAGEDDQASVSVAPLPAETETSAVKDAFEAPENFVAGSEPAGTPAGAGLLNWLYAFILGILLIVVGLFLVNRA